MDVSSRQLSERPLCAKLAAQVIIRIVAAKRGFSIFSPIGSAVIEDRHCEKYNHGSWRNFDKRSQRISSNGGRYERPAFDDGLVVGESLRRWEHPAVGLEELENIVVIVGTAYTLDVVVETIACVSGRLIGGRRVAEDIEQERICFSCIPILSVVDDGVEERVKLLAAEATGERRDEVSEIVL